MELKSDARQEGTVDAWVPLVCLKAMFLRLWPLLWGPFYNELSSGMAFITILFEPLSPMVSLAPAVLGSLTAVSCDLQDKHAAEPVLK